MDSEERGVLEFLTENGYLEGPAHGIALQVIAGGRESLSPAQANVFQEYVVDEYLNLECRRCGSEMPTSEIVAALTEEDDLCSWCRKIESNED
jgi:hypothetical protein